MSAFHFSVAFAHRMHVNFQRGSYTHARTLKNACGQRKTTNSFPNKFLFPQMETEFFY